MTTRTINSVRNPQWADYAQTMIDMEVDFDELDEVYVPFTATANDPESHGVTLWNNAVNGDYGTISAYTPPADITGDEAMAMLRARRDQLLIETDWVETPSYWATLTAEKQAEWSAYRNALRDLPVTYSNVSWVNDETGAGSWSNVTWPTKPE